MILYIGYPLYEAKINIIYGVLQQDQRKSIETCRGGIFYLYEVNDLDSVFDLSLVISEYCEKYGLYKEALEFSRGENEAPEGIIIEKNDSLCNLNLCYVKWFSCSQN
ncbi:hypothetical protein [Bacillus siamensis]|uniref:hypothetical protein n=1 Tax=Bacillus siamensis TaxID=659243 RepID=UPI0022B7C741|nr:hypothetical protein [Bacillus siamensis]